MIDRAGLDRLVEVLRDAGFRVIGPRLRDSAIVLDELDSGAQLPGGWDVEASPGRYRVHRRSDDAVFAHCAGPGSWKEFMHPPHRKLADIGPDLSVEPPSRTSAPLAFLGVRGCDLAALGILEHVLGDAAYPQVSTPDRRPFVVAVECAHPSGVCFCASMGTGPAVRSGFDLALTELVDADGHRFVVRVGSPAGAETLAAVGASTPPDTDVEQARQQVAAAADRMGRTMPEVDLRSLLRDSQESPHWEDVAGRCLTCANCTMVCPTCFCTSAEDVADLTGDHAERWQRWASCFEPDFSYLHGGSVRQSGASRYRQWLTHKLGTWHDQFGSSGCVGCGRCITWCPVAIDITEEVAAIRATAGEESA